MSCCQDESGAFPTKLEPPRRNHFFYGKLMDVLHFQMEQDYGNAKRALINRLTLGEGVLCGLQVTASDGKLCVSPGVAIDALGREIIVSTPVCIDPWAPPSDACDKPTKPLDRNTEPWVTLCIAYRECQTDYGPVLVPDCDTKNGCAAGTIVESFALKVLPKEPPLLEYTLPDRACFSIFHAAATRRRGAINEAIEAIAGICAEPPADTCVPLAYVKLRMDGTIGAIRVNGYRPRVYSNAMLLDLILCLAQRVDECCGEGDDPTPSEPKPEAETLRVKSIDLRAAGESDKPGRALMTGGVVANTVPNNKWAYINVVFTDQVDPIKYGDQIFLELVNSKGKPAKVVVPGKLNVTGNVALFTADRDYLDGGPSVYRLTLVGNPTSKHRAIVGLNKGSRLDGNPTQLPSGDGHEGDDFVIEFEIH
jgi:hypothetical protein